MKREISWIAVMIAVELVAMAGAAVMTAQSAPERTMEDTRLGGVVAGAVSHDHGPEAARAGIEYAVQRGRQEELIEPAAICRLIPECSKNSDCDEQCGAGLGKCVHSNCPVRICRCR